MSADVKTENENIQYIYEDDQLLEDIDQQELTQVNAPLVNSKSQFCK